MAEGIGTGTSIAFTGGSFVFNGQVTNASIDGEEVAVVDMSHMLTTGYREKAFGALIEPPQITVEINYDPQDRPAINEQCTITLTHPDASTMTGTGRIISRGAELPLEDKMTGTYVFQFDGVTGPTFSDGSA